MKEQHGENCTITKPLERASIRSLQNGFRLCIPKSR